MGVAIKFIIALVIGLIVLVFAIFQIFLSSRIIFCDPNNFNPLTCPVVIPSSYEAPIYCSDGGSYSGDITFVSNKPNVQGPNKLAECTKNYNIKSVVDLGLSFIPPFFLTYSKLKGSDGIVYSGKIIIRNVGNKSFSSTVSSLEINNHAYIWDSISINSLLECCYNNNCNSDNKDGLRTKAFGILTYENLGERSCSLEAKILDTFCNAVGWIVGAKCDCAEIRKREIYYDMYFTWCGGFDKKCLLCAPDQENPSKTKWYWCSPFEYPNTTKIKGTDSTELDNVIFDTGVRVIKPKGKIKIDSEEYECTSLFSWKKVS